MSKSVLILGNFLSAANGGRGVCEDLALWLSNAGWRVYCASNKPRRVARLTDMLWTAWRRRHDFDVAQIDVFSGAAFCWAEAACRVLQKLHKPFVLTLHGGALPEFAQRHPRRVSRLLRAAGAVTAPSRYLLEKMCPYQPDITFLPNPLATDRYTFRERSQPSPRLIWLRAFHSIYNPSLAPRVVAELAKELPGVELTMIGPDKGDGSLQAALREARALGVADRCSFEGAVAKADVPAWLNRGDIFLNTTNIDNTPVSVLEALACGLPVVSTNVGGVPYLLQDGRDALLVPPNDASAMAAAVLRLQREPGLSQRLSHAGRAKAEHCDWSVVLPRWESLLASVAGSRYAAPIALG